jgi:hypothetical protein
MYPVVYNACQQLHKITIKGQRFNFSSFRKLQDYHQEQDVAFAKCLSRNVGTKLPFPSQARIAHKNEISVVNMGTALSIEAYHERICFRKQVLYNKVQLKMIIKLYR